MYLAAFRAMQASGFNINRVFLDELPNRGIGGSTDATVRTHFHYIIALIVASYHMISMSLSQIC